MVSSTHNVSAPGTFIAIVSTTVETSSPIKELEPGFALLGNIVERFQFLYSELFCLYPYLGARLLFPSQIIHLAMIVTLAGFTPFLFY